MGGAVRRGACWLAQVNVAPRKMVQAETAFLETVLTHELTHVLGFDPDQFDQFRYERHRIRSQVPTPDTVLTGSKNALIGNISPRNPVRNEINERCSRINTVAF